MNALLLAALLTATPETPTTAAKLELDRDRPTVATLSFSPLTTLMLGVVLEGEFRVHEHVTTYVAGEFYGAWLGWGVQGGVRLYTDTAFRGFFVDLHARASDLLIVHHAGLGLELGAQHQLGRTRWSFLWSVGGDVGMGRWAGLASGRSPMDVPDWFGQELVVVPKLRLMFAYNF